MLTQFSVDNVSMQEKRVFWKKKELYSERNVKDTETSTSKLVPTVADDDGVQQSTIRPDNTENPQNSSNKTVVTP